jgi:branched-chain amino acid transport system permease protein
VPGVNWSATDLVIIGSSLGALAVLAALLYATDIGARMRANADNRDGAGLVGINPKNVARLAWGIGGALAALSGAVLAPKFLLSIDAGSTFTFNAFAAVTIGSVGSVAGAIGGGLFVGLAEALVAAQWNAGYESLVSLGIMFVVLTIRPTGLLSRAA